ncbi:hypothetical protein Tco_1236531 [Tanacetum coccineum]
MYLISSSFVRIESSGYDVLIFIPFVVLCECRHGYAVSSLMDMTYWSSEQKAKRITKISQSSGHIPLVANETVIKEWEDRMERAATTASSLEAEHDSGNINRTQSMATLNESFPQRTGLVSTLDNGEMEIIATIDGKVKIVTEASIRMHLKLEDSDGISNLPTTEIFDGPVVQGEGSTVPVESYHTPTSALSTSQPPSSSPCRRTTIQESVVPQPRFPTQTNVVDEAASTGVDVRHGGAATTSCSFRDRLAADKESLWYCFYKAYKKVKKLEKTVKTRQARRKARIGRHEHDFKFTAAEEIYTAKKRVSTVEPVSTAGASVSIACASSAKDKSKARMEEAETIQTKTKLQLEQERLGYEEALRLQAEIDKEERHRIARVQEEVSFFNIEEWDNIQARVEADEEFAQRLQSEEREMYSEAEKARLLAELINQRKRYFVAQRVKERRNKPVTQAQQSTYMSQYIKNMGSHTLKQLKSYSFNEIKNLFEATMRRVHTFVPMESESKRVILELAARSSKRDAEEELCRNPINTFTS